MPQPPPPADLSDLTLADIARLVTDRQLPPVDSWHPTHCGASGIRIARDGRWWHQGRPIERAAMVGLFSTLLRREKDGRIVLVTPAEKLDVEVDDKPFVAVEVKSEGSGGERSLAFRLSIGDLIIAGPGHRIRIEQATDGPRPALEVRGGLEARIARPVYYELVALALDEANEVPGLWSGGTFFSLGAAP